MNASLKFALRSTAAAAALALGSMAYAAAAFDANIELDNTSREGSNVAAADKGLSQSGRVEINASSKTGDDIFVAGKAAFLAKKDGTLGTDDMWIQLGSSSADVKLGRFEAANVFPLAGDTVVNHAGTVYGANTLRGRKAGDVFHAAGTFKLTPELAVEVGVIQTTTNSLVTATARGWRPVVSYVSGPLAVGLGMEFGEYNSGNKVGGFGLTVGYDFGSFKLTGNYASGKQDLTQNESQLAYALTAGMGALTVGFVGAKNDLAGGDTKVQTTYLSYGMPLLGVKGATVTPALSVSRASNSVTNTNVDETAVRVRLNYAF